MNAASFSSVSEASAAFALGPVRFKCLQCGKMHWSHRDGWERCAEKFCDEKNFRFRRYDGRRVFLPNGGEVRTANVHPWVLLGREKLFKGFYGLFGYEEELLGRMPELLSLSEDAFASLVESVDGGWWGRATERVRALLEKLDGLLPEFPGPAVPMPAFDSSRGWQSVFFDRWAMVLRGSLNVVIHHYSGLEASFKAFSGESAARGANVLLATLGARGVSVAHKSAKGLVFQEAECRV